MKRFANEASYLWPAHCFPRRLLAVSAGQDYFRVQPGLGITPPSIAVSASRQPWSCISGKDSSQIDFGLSSRYVVCSEWKPPNETLEGVMLYRASFCHCAHLLWRGK